MNKRNITLKDIAKECNCSVATVSYVLNNVPNQSISEERRNKILQVANLYRYDVNPYARALAKGKMHNILLYYEDTNFPLYKAEILNFIGDLSLFLKNDDFYLMVTPSIEPTRFDYADAVVVFNSTKDKFMKLANKNFVPLIAFNINIDEPLFFEIHENYHKTLTNYINNTLYQIVLFPFLDESTNNELKKYSNLTFISSFDDLNNFINKFINQSIKVIALNKELDLILSKKFDTKFINLNSKDKFNALIETINLALNKEEVKTHKFIVTSGE